MRLKEKVSVYFGRCVFGIIFASCLDACIKMFKNPEIVTTTTPKLFYFPNVWMGLFSLFLVLMLWSIIYEWKEYDLEKLAKLKINTHGGNYFYSHKVETVAGHMFAYIMNDYLTGSYESGEVVDRLTKATEKSLDMYGKKIYMFFYTIFNYKAH